MTIDVTLRLDVDEGSLLHQLMIEASIIGVQILALKYAQRKIPKAMQDAYWAIDAKIKTLVLHGYGLSNTISNVGWDTDEYLTKEQTLMLTAPAG